MSAQAAERSSLNVCDLTVSRGDRALFADLGFVAEPGEAVLLRGPNGAGKTSLLLAIAGVLRPAAGTIRYGEADEGFAHLIHFMGPLSGIKPRLTVAENLGFWRAVAGPTGESVAAALAAVGLGGLEAIEAGHLSTGQGRRLALARLVVSKRPLWLLDEPTSALDAAGEALVGRLVTAHCAAGGVAVVATHHDLPGLAARRVQSLSLGAR